MTEADFITKPFSSNLPAQGSFKWRVPSNIALVKYWGKYGDQLPKNASVSFTLQNCFTETTLFYELKEGKAESKFEVFLDGEREVGFEPKIEKFFQRIETYVSFIKNYKFRIETTNSFPHSSGIASSASGMGALACCIMSLERRLSEVEISTEDFYRKASFLARLGSGSASRSIEGPMVVWGEHNDISGGSNLFGIKYLYDIHPNFENYQDTILLVDKGEKQVSSTVGHNLMLEHPYAEKRFAEANENLSKLKSVFESGNLAEFIEIVESEALQLHAMMMTSMPYFILMKPNTLEIINKIWAFRKELESNICFTLDAGANVHVLYPSEEKDVVRSFIEKELKQFCKNGEYIHDEVGMGATLV